jgi:hypothetical protein
MWERTVSHSQKQSETVYNQLSAIIEDTKQLVLKDIDSLRKLIPSEISLLKLELQLNIQHVEERLTIHIDQLWE